MTVKCGVCGDALNEGGAKHDWMGVSHPKKDLNIGLAIQYELGQVVSFQTGKCLEHQRTAARNTLSGGRN